MEHWFKTNLQLWSLKNSNPDWSIPGTEEWQILVNKCVSSIKDRCQSAADIGSFQLVFSFYDLYSSHLKAGQFTKFCEPTLAEKLFQDFKSQFKIDTGLEIKSYGCNPMCNVSWKVEPPEAD